MIGFLFPGQGSQAPAMGAPFAEDAAWSRVRHAEELTGIPLGGVLTDAAAPADSLSAQLSVLVVSLMALDVLRRTGVEPDVCAGHSVGEYAALVAAGVWSAEEAMRAVVARGTAMNEACRATPGAMVALRASETEAESVVDRSTTWVAAVNAPDQTVVAGTEDGLEVCLDRASAADIRGRRLSTAGAFHTPLMAPAAGPLRTALADARLTEARVPVPSNVDGVVARSAGEWRTRLVEAVTVPVRWSDCVEAMSSLGTRLFLEVGPGRALSQTVRRVTQGDGAAPIGSPEAAACWARDHLSEVARGGGGERV